MKSNNLFNDIKSIPNFSGRVLVTFDNAHDAK